MPAPDFLADLQAADSLAAEQLRDSNQRLREMIEARAAVEPEFVRALARDPEGTLAAVAQDLGATVGPDLVKETKERYSAAIIGATEAQVNKLVFDTLNDVKRSFNETINLSKWLFYVGLAMTVAAFFSGMWFNGKEVIVGLFGAGGILTVISYVVMNPLDRIRNAAANLVQIQIAYVAYNKQLSLLGGAGDQALSREDAIEFAQELRTGAIAMIQSIQGLLQPAKQTAAPAQPATPTSATPTPDT